MDALGALAGVVGVELLQPRAQRERLAGVDLDVVSLRALFDPARAAGLDVTVALHLGEHRFRARVADGAFEVVRGDVDAPDATVETDASTFLALVRGGAALPDAVAAGDARIEGDDAVVERFLGLFPLPVPA